MESDGGCGRSRVARRPDEHLTSLVDRLDAALETAFTENIYTDEINP